MRSNIGHGSVPMSSVHQGGNGASSLAAAAAVYTFSEAEDGDVAVQMVQDASDAGAPFDIVFMDNIMIHMHGPEAAQLMRSNGFKGLIVGVTGNVMAHYLASGADCVLDKPVNVEDLTIVLKKLL
jgi:CheY-like chemotaxis protein